MTKYRPPFVGLTLSQFDGLMPSALIQGLCRLGVQFIEFNATIFPEMDIIAKKIGSIRTAFHLPLIADDGWDFSCQKFQAKTDKAITLLNQYKKALNIHHVICHPPEIKSTASESPCSLNLLIKNLQKLDIPIHIENVPSIAPDEFEKIFAEIKSQVGEKVSGICFDAPHFFIRGIDPLEQFAKWRPKIKSIHLSDCKESTDAHIPFDSGGVLPVREFLQLVYKSRYDQFITLEIRPNSLKDLDSYIDSYLLTLKYVNTCKYLRTRLKISLLRPFISRFAA